MFREDEEDAWIEHHARHLRDRFPQQVACWFCDDVPFVSERRADRYTNFVWRMQHIHDHILNDKQTRNNMRPDFHIIQHLWEHELIDGEIFNRAINYSKLPPTVPDS